MIEARSLSYRSACPCRSVAKKQGGKRSSLHNCRVAVLHYMNLRDQFSKGPPHARLKTNLNSMSMLPGVFPPGVLFTVRGTNQEQLFMRRTISRGRATLT